MKCITLGIAVVLSLLVCGRGQAELPLARLQSVFPPGGRQGSTVEVTLAGLDLDDVSALRFSDRRLTAKAGSGAGKFVVTVAGDAPVGVYDLRAVGRFGVS